jgi:hypothetical protein
LGIQWAAVTHGKFLPTGETEERPTVVFEAKDDYQRLIAHMIRTYSGAFPSSWTEMGSDDSGEQWLPFFPTREDLSRDAAPWTLKKGANVEVLREQQVIVLPDHLRSVGVESIVLAQKVGTTLGLTLQYKKLLAVSLARGGPSRWSSILDQAEATGVVTE